MHPAELQRYKKLLLEKQQELFPAKLMETRLPRAGGSEGDALGLHSGGTSRSTTLSLCCPFQPARGSTSRWPVMSSARRGLSTPVNPSAREIACLYSSGRTTDG
jgi:hypothetical protein